MILGAPGVFESVAVAGGRDAKNLARVARSLGARFAAIAEPGVYAELKAELAGSGIEAAAGPEALKEAACQPADLVVGAIAGAAGVAPTYAAVEAGASRRAGQQGMPRLRRRRRLCARRGSMGVNVLPMDSEHNAIFQAWAANVEKSRKNVADRLRRAIPHMERRTDRRRHAEQALAHPNWAMGPKVTIDSASLMNKGLELIEAMHIFGIPAEKLDVLVHPQSIVHGLVSFADGAVTAGMATPDMKVPIAHCLAWPHRSPPRCAVSISPKSAR